MSETQLVECSCSRWGSCKPIKLGLKFRWGKIPERFQQWARVEPRDPFERRVFDVLQAPPRSAVTDDLRLEQPDHRFSHRVVVRVAAAAHRRFDADGSQSFGVANREILRAMVAVMHECSVELTVVHRLL